MRIGIAVAAVALSIVPPAGLARAQQQQPGVWKAQLRSGLVVTSGNSRNTTVTAAASASREEGGNKLTVDGGVAFARASVRVARDDGDGVLASEDELDRTTQTTADSYVGRVRYDRSLTPRDAVFATGSAGADRVAGKDFIGGGQAGYSRRLVKTDRHEVVAELGYDFTFQSYRAPANGQTSIHSGRALLGVASKLNEAVSAFANLEVLTNLNEEDAPDVDDPLRTTVDVLQDTRRYRRSPA